MIALSAIVKDEAETIARLLDSVREHVDGVFIFDPGSTDGTVELLEALAEQPGTPIVVRRGVWRDDFARARNESWAMPGSDFEWLMYADGDEVLEGAEVLLSLTAGAADEDDGFLGR